MKVAKLGKQINEKELAKQCAINVVVSRLVCPNNEQHIVKKEGVGKYCMVCGLLK
jgi:hypothetical protein